MSCLSQFFRVLGVRVDGVDPEAAEVEALGREGMGSRCAAASRDTMGGLHYL